ncbi:MAG: ATP-binding protein [Candidatus Aminicenantes bacterium]|jgi:PAS domain S-box-containing protein
MNFFPYLHFFNSIVYGYMAVYILIKNAKAPLNRICSVFLFCLGIWSFTTIFIHNPYSPKDIAMLFANIGSMGWVTFSSFFLLFMLFFTGKEKILKKKWLYLLLFGPPLLFIYKQWTNYIYIDFTKEYYGCKAILSSSTWPLLFLCYYILFMGIGLYINFHFMRHTKNPTLKKQAAIMFVTAVIALILGSFNDMILPLLLNVHVMPDIADTYALIWALGIVYAMVRYKFLTITPATAADNILSTMYDGLILLNMEGEIITVNQAAAELLGYQPEELKGKSVDILLGKEALIDGMFMNILRKGELKNRDLVFKTRQGKEVPILLSVSMLKDQAGNPAGFVCVAKDISERKKLEEEIYKSKKMESIGMLAGGIAHDFNNLFAIIVGNLTLARDEIAPGEKAYKLLLKAEQASLNSAELARKFITFSPGGWLVREELLLGNLLKGLLDSQPGLCDMVSYHIDIARDLASIYGDKGQLYQVMQNLLVNAVEAIEAGSGSSAGRISIRVENCTMNPKNQFQLKPGNYVTVSIEDNGTGIPSEIMDKVFDPYFSTKERGPQKGMGLGLTLCYWIINRHDGHIRLESEPGKGTRVTLYFPVLNGNDKTVNPG